MVENFLNFQYQEHLNQNLKKCNEHESFSKDKSKAKNQFGNAIEFNTENDINVNSAHLENFQLNDNEVHQKGSK